MSEIDLLIGPLTLQNLPTNIQFKAHKTFILRPQCSQKQNTKSKL